MLEELHGRLRWRIKDGLLVSRAGRGSGWLSLDVLRARPSGDPGALAELTIEVEVANFYPSIASGISTFVYEITQSFVHVLVTHAFLRSLASLRARRVESPRASGSSPASSAPQAARDERASGPESAPDRSAAGELSRRSERAR